MTRLLPALASFLTRTPRGSDFADISSRAIHGPRGSIQADHGVKTRAKLSNFRAAIPG